ncbi:hypothetical protein [Vibrio sp. TBV020]|uniref:hypothetical protein n=1 Tax=Vibrio sp. TBV020 TaxID=3137398 RepID=UPI0038CD5D22
MFNFTESFGKAMDWLTSDQGMQVMGSVAESAGDYLVKSELEDRQHQNTLERMELEQNQRLQFNDHLQEQKDDRNQWVESNLAPLDYSMGATRDSLAGGGKLSNGVLQRMRG